MKLMRPMRLLVVLIVALMLALIPSSASTASVYCPHHDYNRHGGNVHYDYLGHKTGSVWHKNYYNRYIWNGARYVFDYGVIRYCYRVDIT